MLIIRPQPILGYLLDVDSYGVYQKLTVMH